MIKSFTNRARDRVERDKRDIEAVLDTEERAYTAIEIHEALRGRARNWSRLLPALAELESEYRVYGHRISNEQGATTLYTTHPQVERALLELPEPMSPPMLGTMLFADGSFIDLGSGDNYFITPGLQDHVARRIARSCLDLNQPIPGWVSETLV